MAVNTGLFSDLQIKKQEGQELAKNELVNTTEEGHKWSSRNVKVPSRFAYAAEYKSSAEYEHSLDEKDWECKECGGDKGLFRWLYSM